MIFSSSSMALAAISRADRRRSLLSMTTSTLDDHALNEKDGRAVSEPVPGAGIFLAFADVHSEDGTVIR